MTARPEPDFAIYPSDISSPVRVWTGTTHPLCVCISAEINKTAVGCTEAAADAKFLVLVAVSLGD